MLTAIAPNAGLIYGPFGSAKTSQIKFLAQYIYKTTGKKTRLISADGGGWSPIQSYVDLDIIQPVSLQNAKFPGEFLKFLLEGHWPDAAGVLKAPTKDTWEQIGAYAIEGIYSISHLLQQHHTTSGTLASMAGGSQSKGQNETSVIKDGADTWTQPGMGFYNYVFQKMAKYVAQSSALPVHKILWTSLMAKFETKDPRTQVITEDGPYGPAIVGKQGIKVIPQWFGDFVTHLDSVNIGIEQEVRADKLAPQSKVGTVQKTARAYLKTHTHPKDGLLIPAIPRVDPSVHDLVPAYHDFTAEEGLLGWWYEQKASWNELAKEKARKELGLV